MSGFIFHTNKLINRFMDPIFKKWNKPVIACCRSGMRSAQATSILNQHGIDCFNGGGWTSLENKL